MRKAPDHRAIDVRSPLALLGGHSAADFMSHYWQKKPLLIRDAYPAFDECLSRDRLIGIACRDDVDARLVVRERGRYAVTHGPFSRRDFKNLPSANWTLLVQGVNRVEATSDHLLRQFAFLPYARLDDVMVSYAAPGGGVGPHFDSYDVFLLQGRGRRRWRFGSQKDLALKPNFELKILRRFSPQHDAVLVPGDMLYLPPAIAHDGRALDACITYSIGFRAATHAETVQAFLDYLRDEIRFPEEPYADPDALPTRYPARIDPAMQRRVNAKIAQLRWKSRDVARFLGRFLSEPKQIVRFESPMPAMSRRAFMTRATARGLALDRATQLLYDDVSFYINGEAVALRGAGIDLLRRLANRRELSARECGALRAPLGDLLYEWYRNGFVRVA